MLDIYTVAFFGHRYIDSPIKIESLLEKNNSKLISDHEYVDFLVGRNGDFDRFASSAVIRMQKRHGKQNSSLILVLPYTTAEYLNNEVSFRAYYSDIEISYAASKSHPKAAIKIRNRELVDRADMIICAVKNSRGGAADALRYAVRQGKRIINLYDEEDK